MKIDKNNPVCSQLLGPSWAIVVLTFGLIAAQRRTSVGGRRVDETRDLVEKCCSAGRQWYSGNLTDGFCGTQRLQPLPLDVVDVEDDLTCRAVRDVCCLTARAEGQCMSGRKTAVTQQNCDSLANPDDVTKECCSCCQLGMIWRRQKFPCELPDRLRTSLQCHVTFSECCHGLPMDDSFDRQDHFQDTLEGEFTEKTPLTSVPGSDLCNEDNPCEHLCAVINSTTTCACREGYRLRVDTTSCQDVNECEENGDICAEGEQCVNTLGGFKCMFDGRREDIGRDGSNDCMEGFAWNRLENRCEDIDECILGIDDCEAREEFCRNVAGGFECVPSSEDDYYYYYYLEALEGDEAGGSEDFEESQSDYYSDEFPTDTLSHPVTTETPEAVTRTLRQAELTTDVTTAQLIRRMSTSSRDSVERTSVTPRTRIYENPSCPLGMFYDSQIGDCNDIDECMLRVDSCDIVENCINTHGSFMCVHKRCSHGSTLNTLSGECVPVTCQSGFTLDDNNDCIDIDECLENLHTCSAVEVCMNRRGSFDCLVKLCSPGFKLNELNGICETIVCREGMMVDSTGHCVDIDECSRGDHSCRPAEECVNLLGSYRCVLKHCPPDHRLDLHTGLCDPIYCPAGFRSNILGQCVDINECEIENICHITESCVNSAGSYNCVRKLCNSGYKLNEQTGACDYVQCSAGLVPDSSGTCTDIDECSTSQHNCGLTENCVNDIGSFHCEIKRCTPGHRLNPYTGLCDPIECRQGFRPDESGLCEDINECDERRHVCRSTEKCENTVGSYVCRISVKCTPGYEPNSAQTQCEDVDECLTGLDNCRGSNVRCVNQPGSYHCVCDPGYRFNIVYSYCEDIDECSRSICARNSECQNMPGSFRCICNDGFQADEENPDVCKDIDECTRTHICHHSCHNSWGSYRCSCNHGYDLRPDNRTCQDVDECESWKSRGSKLCQGRCENSPGSFHCSCPHGYTLAADERSCIDVDECFTPDKYCGSDACINTRGGYRCQRVECPWGFLRNDDDINRNVVCVRKIFACSPGHEECLNAPLSYSVKFISIPHDLLRIPAKLFTMKGPSAPYRRFEFNLELISSQQPRTGRTHVSRQFFDVQQVNPHEAVVSLVREIPIEQDLELEMRMKIYSTEFTSPDERQEIFFGTAIAKIFLYLTEGGL